MNGINIDVEAVLNEHIKNEVEACDVESCIRSEVRRLLDESFYKNMDLIVNEAISGFVKDEIKTVMDRQVTVSDGYGRGTTFDSFESFVRSAFKKRLEDNYKIKAVIEALAKQRVDSLMAQEYAKVTEKIVDVLTQSTLVKKS